MIAFWTRLAATLIDDTIVFIGVLAASGLGVRWGSYVPLELTMIGAAAEAAPTDKPTKAKPDRSPTSKGIK